MTKSIDSLADFVISSEAKIKNAAKEADTQNSVVWLSRPDEVRSVPKESVQKFNFLLPAAASILINFYFKWFRECCAGASETAFA